VNRSVAIIGSRGYPSFYGGFETLVRELAPYLADRGWDVTVYGRPASLTTGLADRDQRVHSVETAGIEKKSLSTLSYGLTSVVHAARKRPDVALVLNVANGYWLPVLRARGIPSLVNVDGIEWERAKWGRAAKSVFKAGAFMTARYGDTLVSDSREIARRWRGEFGRESAFIPYGGTVPSDLAAPDEFDGRPYVLMVARFVPENTVSEFFEAAERLSDNWDIAIVGSSGYGGELEDKAKSLAEQNDRVHWFGHVSDDRKLFSLWKHCSAYFHGHSVGGTNPALVQAMACGAPTVARNTVYNREVLGSSALFSEPTPPSIEFSIHNLMSDLVLQERLRSSSLERAVELYSWNGVCADYERELLNLLPKESAE
jgi:glycosyltransferase involved in cell wall biosynthesis